MKNWTKPEVEKLSIGATAHNWTGIYRDGGYIGDGIISGHGTWTKPTPTPAPTSTPTPTPTPSPTPTLTPEGGLS